MPAFDRDQFKQRMAQDEADMRKTLSSLIDEAYLKFRQAGGSDEEYVRNQFFQNLLFQAVNATYPKSTERIGGLKTAMVFMRRLIQYFEDLPNDPDWSAEHEIRKA